MPMPVEPLHKGRNLNSSQKYENAIWALHPHGKGEMVSKAERQGKEVSRLYAEWSEANPGHSREAGKIRYREIHKSIFG